MKIKSIVWQHRRDFSAEMECEHCGHVEMDNSGYDDAYYHNHVIPNMRCSYCGKKAPDDYTPRETKYMEGDVI